LPTIGWFFGRFEHSLDAKGRLILPAKIRAHFDAMAYLTPHLEGCLGLWTPEGFNREVEQREQQDDQGSSARNALRDWSSRVVETKLDLHGRMAIPPELRAYSGIDQEVVVIGAINRVELWSPGRWQTKDNAAATAGPSSARGRSSRSAAPSL
jgi:MraZ protein